jgi:hypothetical protein
MPDVAIQPIIEQTGRIRSTKIALPPATGADYFFQLYTEPEMQIYAQLTAQNSGVHHFWYRPFESAEFRDSMEALEAAFCETLEKLLTHETRIIQKNGWLIWHFKCEYKTAGLWTRIPGVSYLKFGRWKTPKIVGKIRIYQSPALVLKG